MSDTPDLPQPDPALRRLDRLVGRWSMEGNLVGSDEKNIRGETSFRWLLGGLFLEQRVHIDFMGLQIDSVELIGYDPETDTFPSNVYSNFSPEPLPYKWDVQGDNVTISVSHGPLDSTFTGQWREDGTFSGGWRPNPGADETVNVPYDSGGHVSSKSGKGFPFFSPATSTGRRPPRGRCPPAATRRAAGA